MKLCLLWAASFMPALSCGCPQREGIRSYTVEDLSGEREMEAAAVPGAAWFFKMQGPPDKVLAQGEVFAQIVSSVEFEPDGTPIWATPPGWSQLPPSEMRFATLQLDGSDPPLEVAVSTLPAPDPDSDAYLKMNVDRWRGQVGLQPYPDTNWKGEAEKAGELRESESAGRPVYLVQLSGQDQSGQPSAILGAIMPLPGTADESDAAPQSTTGPPQTATTAPRMPTYSVPAEWTEAAPGQFQLALWTVGNADDQVDISMSAAGGSLDANLARWAGQVGLAPAALEGASESILVDGRAGVRVELVGDEKTVLGVIVPDGANNWFFKLIGPNATAAGERERFQQFIDSVKF